jgi:hypothetical protein
MSSAALAFSPRLRRAAAAERERLGKRLGKAKATVRDRKGELAGAEAEVSELEAGLAVLVSLLGGERTEPGEPPGGLRGQAIREAGIEALLHRGTDAGPIHYRRWLALVEAEAGPVAGKRPDAVFLNQVSRHPLVRSTTKRGFYELDLGATGRLEARVGELRRSLASATAAEAAELPSDLERGSGLVALELARAERALGEAREALPVIDETRQEASRC